MSTKVNVYPIWYGTWSSASKAPIKNFIKSLGAQNAGVAHSVKRWWEINSLYFNSRGKYLSPAITLKKGVAARYSRGKRALSDSDVMSIVYNQMAASRFPYDTNGVYLVLTSGDVAVSTECENLLMNLIHPWQN